MGRLDPSRPTLLPGGVGFPVERRKRQNDSVNRTVLAGMSAAIVLLLALIALVAYPRFRSDSGGLRVYTEPEGAEILVDGKSRGSTSEGPVLLRDLDSDESYRVVASLPGFASASSLVKPEADAVTDIRLKLQSHNATLTIATTPEGADVLRGGTSLGKTPLTLSDLEPESTLQLELVRPGYLSQRQSIVVPKPGESASYSVALAVNPDLAALRINSTPPGAAILQNGQLLAELATPVEKHLVPAEQELLFTLRKEGFKPHTSSVRLERGQRDGHIDAALEPGGGLSIRSNLPGRVVVRGQDHCRAELPLEDCPLDNGSYIVDVVSPGLHLRHRLDVEIASASVSEALEFATVEAAKGFELVLPDGTKTQKRALAAGSHQLLFQAVGNEATQSRKLELQPGQQVIVP